jgi:hypothetical protein
MRRLLRRWFWCRWGAHRDVLDERRDHTATQMLGPQFVFFTLWWRCLDCEDRRYAGCSDNIEEERRAGRIA